MRIQHSLILALAPLFLAACDVPIPMSTASTGGETTDLEEVPEGVVAIAAPNQNLQNVRIEPTDGCYWYRYAGPVETTYLPLLSKDGRPICSRPPAVTTEAA